MRIALEFNLPAMTWSPKNPLILVMCVAPLLTIPTLIIQHTRVNVSNHNGLMLLHVCLIVLCRQYRRGLLNYKDVPNNETRIVSVVLTKTKTDFL
jgi:hypothetical protein